MKKIELAILTGLITAIIISQFSMFAAACEQITQDTLRLHVMANSDSEIDQACKIAVRDAIILHYGQDLANSENLQQSIEIANSLKPAIQYTAQQVIQQMGLEYEVSVQVIEEHFSYKQYDDFTLPAGEYNAIRIDIGKAEGENWFCVLYPSLCLPTAMQNNEMQIYSTAEQQAMSSKYEIKFALLEWLNY